ncbi:hypothetical protein [Micromonospora zingiberis]|nr:hypothetical protein [Micromonospora zingiberis]
MSTPTRRIDRNTAELLLDGDLVALSRAGRLAGTLRALCGPARPYELAGEQAAVAAFLATADFVPTPGLPEPTPLRKALARTLTVKATIVVAATGLGGVALAAGTGALPTPLIGTPAAPPATHAPAPYVPGPPHPAAPGGGSVSPSAGPVVNAAGSPMPAHLLHCQAYARIGAAPGKALENPAFADLVAAAGGIEHVEAYCAASTRTPPGSSGRPSPGPTGTGPGAHPHGGPPSNHPEPPVTAHSGRPSSQATHHPPNGRASGTPPGHQ